MGTRINELEKSMNDLMEHAQNIEAKQKPKN
jgi:hypothetical protein